MFVLDLKLFPELIRFDFQHVRCPSTPPLAMSANHHLLLLICNNVPAAVFDMVWNRVALAKNLSPFQKV